MQVADVNRKGGILGESRADRQGFRREPEKAFSFAKH